MRGKQRFLLLVATVIVLLTSTASPIAAASPRPQPSAIPDAKGKAVPGSYIVTLKAGVDPGSKADALARGAGGKLGRIYNHALHGFVFKGSAKAAAAIARNPNVRTVVPDQTISIAAETVPPGMRRIRAEHPTQPDAHDAGFTGVGVRVAILDTGIDLTHPDLVANIDVGLGMNCMGPGPPQDGHGHGTHVAGIVAAVGGNDLGVIGVAPSARLVPYKVLDDTGQGEWSNLICAIDDLTAKATDGNPANDVRVANMSLGDTGSVGSCTDGGVREAICTSTAAGVLYVAAAGNSTVDASTFIPAAFPEVVTVSAMTDFDGEPGGLAGCIFFIFYCDDSLAEFSNYGSVIDVTAPGVQIYSTWTGGGYNTIDGTSMASPHVAGVAALVRAANPALSPADVEALLKTSGECANGTFADADGSNNCIGKGQRRNDPDGYGEPLVNALHSAEAAVGFSAAPTIVITNPANGSSVSGLVTISANATDDGSVVSVAFKVNGKLASTDTDGSNGWTMAWNTNAISPGYYSLSATATDNTGRTATASVDVSVGTNPQGNWVGRYGGNGYALFAWTPTTDLVLLPNATLSTGGAARSSAGVTTDVRGLQSPDASERRAGADYDASQLRLTLTFSSAYTGNLHLYAVDWTTVDRRQTFTVSDGSGTQVARLSTSFQNGAWLHFPISVASGGTVSITIDRVAGANVLINGLFLGEGNPPAAVPPSAPLGLGATATSTDIGLTWSAPLLDGGSAITGYRIYRGTAPGAGAEIATIGNVLSYTDSTAVAGTRYYYTVAARNAQGTGPRSNERNATRPEIPGAQGNWVATYGHDGYALFAWTPTSDLVLLPHATLTVERGSRSSLGVTTDVRALQSPDASERRIGAAYDATQTRIRLNFSAAYAGNLHLYAVDWTTVDRRQNFTVDDGSGPQVVRLDTSFQSGAWLHFPISVAAGGIVTVTVDRVAGANTLINGLFLGDGGSSPTVPSAPTLTSVTAGNAQVDLAWTAPASDGGSPITAYKLYRSTTSGTETLLTTLGNVLTYTDLAVLNGVTYYYQVAAVTSAGDGARSAEQSAIPAGVPDAPTDLEAIPGDGTIVLLWSQPFDGGSPITGYTVTATPGGVTCTTGVVALCAIGGLTNGIEYTLTVTATNAVGTGPPSAPVTATPVAAAMLPGPPTGLIATPGDATVSLSWTPPASDGGSPIVGYQIYRGTASGAETLLNASDITTYADNTVVNGTTYWYQVTAVTSLGEGVRSTEQSATPATAPSAPTLTSATPGNGQVTLAWTAPASTGGSPITSYTATASPGGLTCSNAGLGCTVIGLTNGTSYSFTVRATNVQGTGPASNSLSATPATAPGAPTLTSATPGNGQVTLAWTAPASTGGSPITSYTATASPGGLTCSNAGLGCTVIGLTNGTSYSFTVRATNVQGTGPASNSLSATPVTVPSAPNNLVAVPDRTKGVDLTWSVPLSNGGSPITGYRIYRGTSMGTELPLVSVGNVTSYRDAATKKGILYYYRVTAINALGDGSFSNEASAVAR